VKIIETEGQRDLEAPRVELPFIGKPIKINKVNIGIEKTPNLANVGDYWDATTIDKITELLHEYQDLFPTKFTDMKGIKGLMGEMRISLKPDERLVKQRPYRLDPKYKEKVKIDLNIMIEAWIIEPVEESEWIIPMVVQDKKKIEIRICVDLRKMNDAYFHDPFPMPFIDELLDNARALTKICSVNRDDYDLRVPTILWAYRTTCKKITLHTPFKLVYGIEAIVPM
jgi:hypothetical protein